MPLKHKAEARRGPRMSASTWGMFSMPLWTWLLGCKSQLGHTSELCLERGHVVSLSLSRCSKGWKQDLSPRLLRMEWVTGLQKVFGMGPGMAKAPCEGTLSYWEGSSWGLVPKLQSTPYEMIFKDSRAQCIRHLQCQGQVHQLYASVNSCRCHSLGASWAREHSSSKAGTSSRTWKDSSPTSTDTCTPSWCGAASPFCCPPRSQSLRASPI
jgi:hypothetical protein